MIETTFLDKHSFSHSKRLQHLEKLNEIFKRSDYSTPSRILSMKMVRKIQIIFWDHTEQWWKEQEEKIIAEDITSKRDTSSWNKKWRIWR
jgi:hypothetical protein